MDVEEHSFSYAAKKRSKIGMKLLRDVAPSHRTARSDARLKGLKHRAMARKWIEAICS